MTAFVIVTVGSRGDVQPFIALARAAMDRGADVTLATHAPFEDLVTSHGIRFVPLHGDPQAIVKSPEGQQLLNTGPNPITLVRRFTELLEPHWEAFVRDATRIIDTADVVVYSPLAFPAFHIARARDIRSAMATFQPLAPTAAFPPVPLGGRSLGPFNRLAHVVMERAAWLLVRRFVNEWRTRSLDLPALGWRGFSAELESTGEPFFFGYSRHLVPRPKDWRSSIRVTGPWLTPPAPDWAPPLDLSDWIDAGPPPVFVGFGSMSPGDPEALAASVVGGVRAAGHRVVVQSGWASLAVPDSDSTFTVSDVDHSWLFPRCSAAIHHGGSGTTATALASGTPSVIMPFFADQPFWADRVMAAGVGFGPLDRHTIAFDTVREAVVEATSRAVRRNAARVGAAVRGEPGPDLVLETLCPELSGA